MKSDTLRKSCLTREDALDFLAGHLSTDREIEIDEHVQQCPACRDRIDRLSDDSDLRDALRAHQHCPEMRGLKDAVSEFRADWYAMKGNAAFEMSGLPLTATSDAVGSTDLQVEMAPIACPRRLGRFHILRRLGRGGFGVVYLADDTLLHRQVALKIPRLAPLDDPQQRTRFLREGRATAGLYHSHILPMYEAGELNGLCYLTSMYCSGPTLAAWRRNQNGPTAPQTAACIVMLLADALEHAHQHGVLHRDVKPGNILLDTTCACGPLPFTPLLADFGLAKLVDADLTATASNALLGTPRYMAPEQAMGHNGEIGPATDVYSLGTVLYELVTGVMPIEGGDNADTLRRLVTDLPAPPRRQVPEIPRDLEAICLKCLEKSPEHRYATAAELAADLRRFLDGIPTEARPMPIPARMWRWAKRHPGPTGVLLTLVIATAIVWTLILVNSHRIDTANTNLQHANMLAQNSQQQAEQSSQRALQLLYASDMALADRACQHGDVWQMLTLLNRHRPAPGEPDIRGFEWYFLYRTAQMSQRTLLQFHGDVYTICFSEDGDLFAAAGEDGFVKICDGRTFQTRRVLNTGQGEINGVTFAPDGSAFATAGQDGTVRVWDVMTGLEQLQINVFKNQAYCVVFTPDGKRLITCGEGPVIRVWDRNTGRAVGALQGHTHDVESIAISPDGHRLVSASQDRSVRLWNLDTDKESVLITNRKRQPIHFSSVVFSPNGKQIAIAALDGSAFIWDVASRQDLTEMLLHIDGIHSLAFSPDGKLLATGDRAGTVRIWKIANHRLTSPEGAPGRRRAPIRFWTAHSKRVWSLRFSPDGTQLITAGGDGLVKAWSLKSLANDNHLLAQPGEGLEDFTFLPSGQLVTAGTGAISTWNLATRKRTGHFTDSDAENWQCIAISGSGRLLAAGNSTGLIRLWDTTTHAPVAQWQSEQPTRIEILHLTPDGKLLAVNTPNELWVFEVPTFQRLSGFPTAYTQAFSFSPDGRRLALATNVDGPIKIWDVATRQKPRRLSGQRGSVFTLAYSPDGRFLVSGGDDRLVRLWPLDREALPVILAGHRGRVTFVGFSPDGRSLISIDQNEATGHPVSTLKVWSTATGAELLSRTDGKCIRAAISSDGHSLVIQEIGGRIRVIDVSPQTDRR